MAILYVKSLPFVEIISGIGGGVSFLSSYYHLLFLFKVVLPYVSYFPSFGCDVRRLRSFISYDWILDFCLFGAQLIVRANFSYQFGIVWRLKASVVYKQIFLGLKLFSFHLLF